MADAPIVIAPNAFKGTLSPLAAAEAMASGARRVSRRPLILRPLPDGGDGTLDVVLAVRKGTRVSAVVTGACGDAVMASYGLFATPRGPLAVIESAEVLGLWRGAPCPLAARTSFGLGELMRHALDHGARSLSVALGGTATCDAGVGCLTALAARFPGHPDPRGGDLADLRAVDVQGLDRRLSATRIVGLADVMNPLLGPGGALRFALQKGARAEDLAGLAAGLAHAADVLETGFGAAVRMRPGSGAAGGLGFALALLGARLTSGARTIARLIGLPAAIARASLVVTGEGACDDQTLAGKGPGVVAEIARRHSCPAIAVCGRIEPSFGASIAGFVDCVPVVPGLSPAEGVAQATAAALAAFR